MAIQFVQVILKPPTSKGLFALVVISLTRLFARTTKKEMLFSHRCCLKFVTENNFDTKLSAVQLCHGLQAVGQCVG